MRGKIWLGGPRAVVPGTGESGAEVLLPAGLGSCTGLYVAVRGIGGEGAGAHVHMADSVAGTSIIERRLCRSEGMWRCRQERAVKPSAQPTLVRTQHLPPPAKTARWLRKRGPAGRLLLVPPCVIVCRCRPLRSDRYGHMADSVRAEASGPRNRLLCRSAPVLSRYTGTRTARLTGACRASRAGRFLRRSARSWAAGWSCSYLRPGQAAGSARAISSRLPLAAVTGSASPPPGMEGMHGRGTAPWRTALCPNLERRGERRRQRRMGFPVSLSGTGSGGAGHVPGVDW